MPRLANAKGASHIAPNSPLAQHCGSALAHSAPGRRTVFGTSEADRDALTIGCLPDYVSPTLLVGLQYPEPFPMNHSLSLD